MLSLTRRRFAVAVLATVGLLAFAVLLLTRGGASDPAAIGPIGSVAASAFANACAINAAWGSRGRQRLAWIVLAIGLGGWTAGNAVWCYVSLSGAIPSSNLSAANLGYLVLPLGALAAAVVLPSSDDSRFGIGLLLDGMLVTASLLIVVAILGLGHLGQTGRTISVARVLFSRRDSRLRGTGRHVSHRRAESRGGPQTLHTVSDGGVGCHCGGRDHSRLGQPSRSGAQRPRHSWLGRRNLLHRAGGNCVSIQDRTST